MSRLLGQQASALESILTPAQRYEVELARIQEQFEAAILDGVDLDTAMKLADMAELRAKFAMESARPDSTGGFAGAALQGSREAYSAIIGSADHGKMTAENTKRIADLQEQALAILQGETSPVVVSL